MEAVDSEGVRSYLLQLQEKIIEAFLEVDPDIGVKVDPWKRPEGGGGCSHALENGAVFEKASVNFSDVEGSELPPSATAHRETLAGRAFRAMGVSVIVHPFNPYLPTTHMNVRFISAEESEDFPSWWFGGGFDLTPYYGFAEDAIHWHRTAKKACDPFGGDLYNKLKEECDRYFFIRHRAEARGVGGLFFDDFYELGFEKSFQFTRSVGDHFLSAYQPIIERRKGMPYGERERRFQLYRRGRYVEFNLVYDRGTLFGLQSSGRTKSILMSLPPLVRWDYDWSPEKGSPEARLHEDFLKPRDWIGELESRRNPDISQINPQ